LLSGFLPCFPEVAKSNELYLMFCYGLKQSGGPLPPAAGNHGTREDTLDDRMAACSMLQSAPESSGNLSVNVVDLQNSEVSHSGMTSQRDHWTDGVQLDVIKKQMEEQAEVFAQLRAGVCVGFSCSKC
jgi:hypothetical protein